MKILFGACDLTFTYFFLLLFWGGCDGTYNFEILVIQAINCSGHLKVGVGVLLCFTYHFVMPKFVGKISTFGELGDHGDRFLGFPNFFGSGGVYWG